MASSSDSSQPQINQKLLQRTALFLVLLAVCFGGLRYYQSKQGDFDSGGDSTGMIAAIRRESDGQQAVLIGPGGTIKTTTSWKTGVTDREPVWSPDGRFLFFCSDREKSTYNIFRWNPQRDDAENRTIGGTSRSNPTFASDDTGESLLMIMGGTVRELDPKTKKTPQVLPPQNAEVTQSGEGDESGTEGAFSAIYGNLGKSFRLARYMPGRQAIAAIMRREEGEILVYQSLQEVNGKLPKPNPIAAGDRIDFDVDPKGGKIVYSVQNFRWPDPAMAPPQYRKENKITVPFRNMIGFLDPAGKSQGIIAAAGDDKQAFGTPRIAPDGSRFVVIGGHMEEGSLHSDALLTVPTVQQGIASASVLTKGEIYEPAWSLDGKRLVYAKRVGGKRDLFTMGSDGTNEASLTKGQGDFSNPLFSPKG